MGINLWISFKFKCPSTCENEHFNLPQPIFFVFIFETFSFCAFARVENVLLQTTTLCEFANLTMSTLNVLENGMVGMLSM